MIDPTTDTGRAAMLAAWQIEGTRRSVERDGPKARALDEVWNAVPALIAYADDMKAKRNELGRLRGDTIIAADKIAVERDTLRARVAELEAERNEGIRDLFYAVTQEDTYKPGWWCTNAMTDACWAGEQLVKLGVFDAHPDNNPTRKVRWYRPKQEARP